MLFACRTCIIQLFVIYFSYRAEELERYTSVTMYTIIVDIISTVIQLIIMYYTIKMFYKDND